MPEYLAPGVYVEETSFRAKSIEGVSTSTTGFTGLTRKGPLDGTPELITSFGDFERIYGGFADLELGGTRVPNYLAHAVRAYFDNGGARLYVARVYAPAAPGQGTAASAWTGDGPAESNKIRFVARHPGGAGNGRAIARLVESPATVRGMKGAPEGTLLRIDVLAAGPARAQGGKAPFSLQNDTKLKFVGRPEEALFRGQSAELTGTVDLAANVVLGTDNQLKVDLGRGPQVISLPAASTARATLVALIDQALVGGYARLQGNKLVLGSEVRGYASSVKVLADNPAFGVTANQEVVNLEDAQNTVGDLFQVTVADVHKVLQKTFLGDFVATASADGDLLVATTATGAAASLTVEAVAGSAHGELGLDTAIHKGSDQVTGVTYVKTGGVWKGSGVPDLDVSALAPTASPGQPGQPARFVGVNVVTVDADGDQKFYEDLGLAPGHPRYVGVVLGANPGRRIDALQNPFALELGVDVTPLRLLQLLTPAAGAGEVVFTLTNGDDGGEPLGSSYEAPLDALGRIENVSIVAAPGHSAYADYAAIQGELIQHVERRRAYRVAVLDTPRDQTTGQAIDVRSKIDSTRAALYYPWVVTDNPLARPGDDTIPREITLPPSGFVCGIYARNDVERSVAKAPANEIVRGALRFETDVNFAEQEVLNPAGVNCLRFFPGRGHRVWGARTASSDPEWKYVNVRRYFLFLEHSIDRGTQWSVFENNGERLWANVRETIESFLYNEWRSGNLLGGSPAEAYFVRCDRSTMTQNDLDNGRLICLIGVAVLKPAEFVIFRIGQKTADARS